MASTIHQSLGRGGIRAFSQAGAEGRRRREQQEAAAWARQQQEAAQRRHRGYRDEDDDAWSDQGSDGGVYNARGGAFAGGIAAISAEDIQRAVERKRGDARAAAGRRWSMAGAAATMAGGGGSEGRAWQILPATSPTRVLNRFLSSMVSYDVASNCRQARCPPCHRHAF